MCSFLVTDPGIDRSRCVKLFVLRLDRRTVHSSRFILIRRMWCVCVRVCRLMKIAVVHDLAEALVGDIVPHDTRYTMEQKRAMEEVGGRFVCLLRIRENRARCVASPSGTLTNNFGGDSLGQCRRPSGRSRRTWATRASVGARSFPCIKRTNQRKGSDLAAAQAVHTIDQHVRPSTLVQARSWWSCGWSTRTAAAPKPAS